MTVATGNLDGSCDAADWAAVAIAAAEWTMLVVREGNFHITKIRVLNAHTL